MAFKMKGFPMMDKPYKKTETIRKDPDPDFGNNKKEEPGLFEDMSGAEMEAYINKIKNLGDKATKDQKNKAKEYEYYMNTERE